MNSDKLEEIMEEAKKFCGISGRKAVLEKITFKDGSETTLGFPIEASRKGKEMEEVVIGCHVD